MTSESPISAVSCSEKERRERKECSHLEQVLTQIIEDLIQALIGQICIAESEHSHRRKHLEIIRTNPFINNFSLNVQRDVMKKTDVPVILKSSYKSQAWFQCCSCRTLTRRNTQKYGNKAKWCQILDTQYSALCRCGSRRNVNLRLI